MELNTLAKKLHPDLGPYQHPMVLREESVKSIYTFGATLTNLVRDFVGASSDALTYDDEIVYNSLVEKTQSRRQQIIDQNVRNAIIAHPHSTLLCHAARQKVPTIIRIWMFGFAGYVLQLQYVPEANKFRASMYATEAYRLKYGLK